MLNILLILFWMIKGKVHPQKTCKTKIKDTQQLSNLYSNIYCHDKKSSLFLRISNQLHVFLLYSKTIVITKRLKRGNCFKIFSLLSFMLFESKAMRSQVCSEFPLKCSWIGCHIAFVIVVSDFVKEREGASARFCFDDISYWFK